MRIKVWISRIAVVILIGILCLSTNLIAAADGGPGTDRYDNSWPGGRIPIPSLNIRVSAPDVLVSTPFITIVAEESLSDQQIYALYGTYGDQSFRCESEACRIVVFDSAKLSVRARSTLGDESQEFTFSVNVTKSENLYLVRVVKAGPVETGDSCSDAWMNVSTGGTAMWQYSANTVEELRTENTLYLLAARLIQNGLVDASSCPAGGLYNSKSANACGIEASRKAVNEWQNRFDPVILAAARDVGIPAKVLKSLIEQESQFWPGNVRSEYFEYGLGQITEQGTDVGLRWDQDLYGAVCDGLLYDCDGYFASQSDFSQATLRGGLMRWFDATCSSCEYGVDIAKAERSIKPLAQVVRANCYQVGYIMERRVPQANYETLWKFTLLSYHAGYQCLDDAIAKAARTDNPLTWEGVAFYLNDCPAGAYYIDELWPRLATYPTGNRVPTPVPIAATPMRLNTPTPRPTATPMATQMLTPSPTPVTVVNGKVSVVVFVDFNDNEQYDDGEAVENAEVVARFYDNSTLTIPVRFGLGSAPFYGKVVDRGVYVELRSLYRGVATTIPADGQVIVVFRLPPPDLPVILP